MKPRRLKLQLDVSQVITGLVGEVCLQVKSCFACFDLLLFDMTGGRDKLRKNKRQRKCGINFKNKVKIVVTYGSTQCFAFAIL